MKKTLFINGCVREEQSRTLKIAKTYIDTLKENCEFELIERNLCKENISFLSNENFNAETGQLNLTNKTALAIEFASADEIIIAAPFWEFLFPAIVSCYIEMVSEVGITFKYGDQGSVGLCKANSMTYIYSSGDELQDEDKICEKYLQRLSKLYGIPKFSVISAQGLDIQTNCADTIVNGVLEKIKSNNISE